VQSKSKEVEYTFLNAAMVADAWLVHAAGFKVLAAEKRGALKTHSLHGELVFMLGGIKHIAESFKTFGLQPDTTAVLVARFDPKPEEEGALLDLMDGQLMPLDGLSALTDVPRLCKHHKLTKEEEALGDRVASIVTRIAVRDC